MKNENVISLIFIALCFSLTSCKKNKGDLVVITKSLEYTSGTSGTCISEISDDGGMIIYSRGVCWGESPYPTIQTVGDLYTYETDSNGIETGTFRDSLNLLAAVTTYYLRAYAVTNKEIVYGNTISEGIEYGNTISFTTKISPIIFNTSTNYGTVTDFDGNVYKTITLGDEVWMAENLKTTRYSNGDLIGTTDPASKDISNETNPKYQWAIEGNNEYIDVYGRLYTWYAATDSRNICPVGWHLPRNSEWHKLFYFAGESSSTGLNLKEAGFAHWYYPNKGGTNEYGFTAIPSGTRYPKGNFPWHDGRVGYWWSATKTAVSYGPYEIYDFCINWYNDTMPVGLSPKNGNSVRCIKD